MVEPTPPTEHDPQQAPTTSEPPRRRPLPAPEEHDVALLVDAAGLGDLARHLAGCAEVSIDTEANSMHAYREQTCIMQVTAGGRSAIVDVLAVGDLGTVRTALDRSDVEIVFHGGDYDITVLTRDHDFHFERVFDTMIAATLLGDERVGLASLVEDHFGIKLDKKYQRADWARRPLTSEQLDYLRRDTMYLPALRAHYGERLQEADLEEEAAIEFRRLALRRGVARTDDNEGWRRIKGAGRLDPRGRTILRALHLWREKQAEARDTPPFKVLSPRTMVQIAERPPQFPRGARDVPFLGERERRRYGRALADVLGEAKRAYLAEEIPPKSLDARPTPEAVRQARVRRTREERIKDWRRKEARKRTVPNVVVLPNPALAWMVETMPASIQDLAACPDIGPKRVSRYGATWIDLLAKG